MFSGIQKNIRHLFRPGAPLRSRNKKRKQEEAIGRSHDGFTRKPRSERSSLLAPPQQPLRLAEALRRELMASTRPPCQASPHRSVPAPPAPHSAVGQHRFIISYPPFPVEHTSARCPISRTTSKGIVSGAACGVRDDNIDFHANSGSGISSIVAGNIAFARGPMTTQTHLRCEVARFQAPILRRSLWQIATSFGGFFAVCAAMYALINVSYWLMLLLSPVAAGFLVRIFIIQHDCGHRSFFRARYANDLAGVACSMLTLTPYSSWRRQHAGHHGIWNN